MNDLPMLPSLEGLGADEFRAAMTELCDRGLITCTHGRPGDDDATYALAWMPLDNPERFPAHVRERHARNMQVLLGGAQWMH